MALRVLGIVCHVSASDWGDADAINQWHRDRGWSQIGYHGVILNGVRTYKAQYDPKLDGHIQPGRPESMIGAHCLAGGMNSVSIGVCCIGNPDTKHVPPGAKPADDSITTRPYLTQRQFEALVHWIKANCKQYGLDPHGTFRHPMTGKIIPVITQHSDHDRGKPYCASLDMKELRKHL